MNLKKFEQVTKFLSILLKILSVICLLSFVVFTFLFIFKRTFLLSAAPLTELPLVDFPIITATKQSMTNSTEMLANCTILIPLLIVYFYIFFKGSQFFSRLAEGRTPFSYENYKLLKIIGLLIIIVNLTAPLLYSFVATLSMPNGYFVSFGFDIEMIIGLIIYCMAEVIRYGVTLQHLSDETV